MNKMALFNVVIGILSKLVLLSSNSVKLHYNFRIMRLNPQFTLSIICILLSFKLSPRLSVFFTALLIMIF
jgi:hypothetical protein